jgi:hypothetical protein
MILIYARQNGRVQVILKAAWIEAGYMYDVWGS